PRPAGAVLRQGPRGQGAGRGGVRNLRVWPAADEGGAGEAVPVFRMNEPQRHRGHRVKNTEKRTIHSEIRYGICLSLCSFSVSSVPLWFVKQTIPSAAAPCRLRSHRMAASRPKNSSAEKYPSPP